MANGPRNIDVSEAQAFALSFSGYCLVELLAGLLICSFGWLAKSLRNRGEGQRFLQLIPLPNHPNIQAYVLCDHYEH